jgi:two-component system cell cycle sensor histidine kinase/response regulator CckA
MRDDVPLSQEQHLYRLLFEQAADGVIVMSAKGDLLQMNRAARELDIGALISPPAGATEPQVLSAFRRELVASGRATTEVRVGGGCTARHLKIDGHSHGGHHVLVVRDITEPKRVEDELRQLRRAESIGYLTASVVHDFNNLLTPIVCASSMLANEIPRDTQAFGLLEDIRAAAERATGLVRQVLSIVRRETVAPQRVDVGAVTSELRALIRRVVGEEIELDVEQGEKVGDALVDREQLEQVILNLAANARDAMPNGGRLTVRTGSVTLDEDEAGAHACPSGGSYVVLSVTDTGSGMSAEVRERIFERFYTTKDAGHGTGLGLASARRFVAQSGGCMSVHSDAGHGTTVAVYLPRAVSPSASDSASRSSAAPDSARGSETILVVEDDDHVRRVVRAVLEEEGYGVLDAPSGDLALRYVERHDGRIDLVLTDVVMPGMSGRAFVEKLRRDGYGAKVLFMSGHTDRAIDAHGVGQQEIIRKAFTPAALARKVREVLDATG